MKSSTSELGLIMFLSFIHRNFEMRETNDLRADALITEKAEPGNKAKVVRYSECEIKLTRQSG